AVTFKEIHADGVIIESSQGLFSADQCIICNGAWSAFYENDVQVKLPIFPIRGQICAFEQGDKRVRHMILSSQGYVVYKDTKGTIVCAASEDIAGFDHSVTEKGIYRLIKWSRRLYPFLNDKNPVHRWAGLRPATQDGYPLIGRLEQHPHIIISSGHYRNGIL